MTGHPLRKTYEEHLQYLHEIVKLKLFFLRHWLTTHAEESFSSCIRGRVDIYRKTDLNPGDMDNKVRDFSSPGWQTLEEQAHQIYIACAPDSDSARFERKAFEVFKPSIDARSRRDFAEPPYWETAGYQCESLKYDPPNVPEWPNYTHIHIANALSPRSIFDDPRYLPQRLMELMDKAEAEFGVDKLRTGSWLNSHPKWVALFPHEWKTNMTPEDHEVKYHLGFWGQFITARGTFNGRLASQLRQTGNMPFLMRHSWCTFASLRRHVRECH